MNSILRYLASILLLTLAAFAADLRILSYNVRYPNPNDGPNRWDVRRDLLITSIREARADLIGTQELFQLQGDYIVEKLPEFAWFGRSRRGNHEDEHMGVFYRKSRLTLIESGDFWLSETPDQVASMSWDVTLPRMVTWGLFVQNDTKQRFYFLNTHFPHRRQDEDARTQCARVIAAHMAKLPAGVPLILTGDFNTGLDSEAYRILTAALKDARSGLKDPAGDTGTFHGFSDKPGVARIDWILYRGQLSPRTFETITTKYNGLYPSDHFAVLAEFR